MNKYAIINIEAIQKRIEECDKEISILQRVAYNQLGEDLEITNIAIARIYGEKDALNLFKVQSTPLIPEIEKAFTKGERYGWDSQKSIGNIDEMKEKIKLQSLDDYISNLKLDI